MSKPSTLGSALERILRGRVHTRRNHRQITCVFTVEERRAVLEYVRDMGWLKYDKDDMTIKVKP